MLILVLAPPDMCILTVNVCDFPVAEHQITTVISTENCADTVTTPLAKSAPAAFAMLTSARMDQPSRN